MADDLIGRTLGRYQITGLVGRGGMATVYRATHPGLEQTVAVKVLHAHLATDADLLGRFQREARAVAALRHPNIVRVVDFDCIDDVYFMVMEYIDGPTLSAHLGALAAGGRRMPGADVLRVFEPLCAAVDYAHGQGMIHRDIKPSNILLTAQGEPVLTDYGIAKMIGVAQHTTTGTVIGSAYYMSPEQAQGIAVDGRTDVYSLGVMLFESLTGRVPYEGDTLATILVKHITAPVPAACPLNDGLPPLIDGLMRVALAKDPEERFQSGRALAVALRQGLGPLAAQGATEPATATRVELPLYGGTALQGLTRVEAATPATGGAAARDVFISYAASDRAVAESACAALESENVRCWIAPRDVLPGQSFAQALVSAIHAARVFVLVFSSATNRSQQVERELDMAVSSGLPILPLRVEDVLPRESIEYYLAGQHWLDALTPPLDDHLRRLAAAVATLLRRSPEPQAPAAEADPEPEIEASRT
jgi:tRNA A-37 threonylcarbamoyl transferase component Bud32